MRLESIGKNIRKYRLMRKLRQEDLADVLDNGYLVKDSLLAQKLDKLSAEDRSQIYDVIDTMIKHSKQAKP